MPFNIKKISHYLMFRKITTVISFKIENIKTLFRGLSKDDSKKVIYIHQAPEGNIKKFVQAKSELIKSHKVDFSSMERSSWI